MDRYPVSRQNSQTLGISAIEKIALSETEYLLFDMKTKEIKILKIKE